MRGTEKASTEQQMCGRKGRGRQIEAERSHHSFQPVAGNKNKTVSNLELSRTTAAGYDIRQRLTDQWLSSTFLQSNIVLLSCQQYDTVRLNVGTDFKLLLWGNWKEHKCIIKMSFLVLACSKNWDALAGEAGQWLLLVNVRRDLNGRSRFSQDLTGKESEMTGDRGTRSLSALENALKPET